MMNPHELAGLLEVSGQPETCRVGSLPEGSAEELSVQMLLHFQSDESHRNDVFWSEFAAVCLPHFFRLYTSLPGEDRAHMSWIMSEVCVCAEHYLNTFASERPRDGVELVEALLGNLSDNDGCPKVVVTRLASPPKSSTDGVSSKLTLEKLLQDNPGFAKAIEEGDVEAVRIWTEGRRREVALEIEHSKKVLARTTEELASLLSRLASNNAYIAIYQVLSGLLCHSPLDAISELPRFVVQLKAKEAALHPTHTQKAPQYRTHLDDLTQLAYGKVRSDDPESGWDRSWRCHGRERAGKDGSPCVPLTEGMRHSVCARCRSAHYCSRAHQRKDWKRHKTVCFPITWHIDA